MRKVTSDVWWKNAIVYCLDVQTFYDADGDGWGDLAGLTERLDYLAGLGVTCVWLMPFMPSPGRDDGYDIVDFYGVDERLGTLGDFAEMVRTARDRGIRVIVDLVVNHTSHRHPWFAAARSSRTSPYRGFYVWADEKPEEEPGTVFPGEESSVWAYDEGTAQWYLHRFYAEQPDLNVANPDVRDEIAQIAGFWLRQGVAGFRIDAVPFLIEPTGLPDGALGDPHELLRELRSYASRRSGESVLMGEVNLEPAQQRAFFGDEGGDELNMVLSFPVNQAMFLALAREDARPLARALEALPELPQDGQWAHFVRNHDELTLDRLSEDEREEVFAAFGPAEDMQLYGRGIRRRAPTMLGGDPARIRLVYSLMLSLPGTPVLFYGEEIGLAENLAIEGRLSVRAPMQWSAEEHGGFAPSGTAALCRPQTSDPRFGPEAVNVAAQRRDPGSLLNWVERTLRRRRECPELGWGRFRLLPTAVDAVLAHRADWDGATVVAAHNLAGSPASVELALEDAEPGAALSDLFGADELPLADGRATLELEPYGHRWFRLRRPGRRLPP